MRDIWGADIPEEDVHLPWTLEDQARFEQEIAEFEAQYPGALDRQLHLK